jgi:sugar phosphate permease
LAPAEIAARATAGSPWSPEKQIPITQIHITPITYSGGTTEGAKMETEKIVDATAPASSSIQEKMTQFRWVVLVLIFLVYTVITADRANIGVALPFLRKEFQMSNTQAGAIASIFLFAYAIAMMPAGYFCSKTGVRRALSLGLLGTSLFTGLIGTAGSVLMLKVFRFGLGVAEAPVAVGIPTTINSWFPPHEKGTAAGIYFAAAKFGPVLVPPICAVIIAMAGWRQIFFLFAIPGVILAGIWHLVVKNDPSECRFCSPAEVAYIRTAKSPVQQKQAEKKQNSLQWLDRLILARKISPIDSTSKMLRSWDIWGSMLGYFFILGIVNVILAWIPTYLMSVKHFSVMKMGFVATTPWVGAVLGNMLGGWFSDRIIDKRRKPLMLVTALSTAGMMYALIHSSNDAFLLGLLLLVTGVLLNLGYSGFAVYPMGLTTKKQYPIAFSFTSTGGQLGGSCGPLIAGVLLDHFGWDAVFIFLAISAALCFLVLLTIREPIEDSLSAEPVKA